MHPHIAGHLGSASLVANDQGGVVGRQWYFPYGEVRWSEDTLPTDYTFTGQRDEAGTGLYQMGARWYDPRIGRWISADTLVPEPGNPQVLNRYAYVTNNPLRYTDPSGHWVPGPQDWPFAPRQPLPPWPPYEKRFNASAGTTAFNKAVYTIFPEFKRLNMLSWAIARTVAGPDRAVAVHDILSIIADNIAMGWLCLSAGIVETTGPGLPANTSPERGEIPPAEGIPAGERLGYTETPWDATARGGTYRLIDPTTGEVQYVGRTNDLARRRAEHALDPIKGQLRFQVDWMTDDYVVRRGREQMLYDLYRPPLNRIRPISPRNPYLQEYLDAARRFGEMMR